MSKATIGEKSNIPVFIPILFISVLAKDSIGSVNSYIIRPKELYGLILNHDMIILTNINNSIISNKMRMAL